MKPLPHHPETSQLAANADRLFSMFKNNPTPTRREEARKAHEDFATTLTYEDVEAAFVLAERLRELE